MKQLPKIFNTAGPIQPDIHYYIEPLKRIDLEEVEMLIYQRKYFILHASRQTGKTTCLLALRDYLNARGEFIAVYANVEAGQAMRNQVDDVVKTTAETIAAETRLVLKSELPNDVLRQIRAGYANRPAHFPQTIILCGIRDVRDYRIVLSNQDIVTGGSAFNIKAESLHLGNFTKEEIRELYMQHTAATGQEFDEACFPLIWEATEGQPWLVNALGYEVTMRMKENRDRSIRIIPEMIYRAQEQIIYRRDTHIDILIDKLREEKLWHRTEEYAGRTIEVWGM
ncbi:MAG: hypothetical protein K2I11_12375 [Bacteroides sp.]|nr:hypothetical protein [Bacteroides sp.]MDE5761698.1 hypothetical protein [Bacteroides sp.]